MKGAENAEKGLKQSARKEKGPKPATVRRGDYSNQKVWKRGKAVLIQIVEKGGSRLNV